MCHSHQRYYTSPTCYRRTGYRRPHGCFHRRCTKITTMQHAPLTIASNPQVITIETVPTLTRGVVRQELPTVKEKAVVEPPPYTEKDNSHVPGSGRGYGKDGVNEPVPLEKLQKAPAYVVVLPPPPPPPPSKVPLTESVPCVISKATQTRETPLRIHSSFLLPYYVTLLEYLHLYHHCIFRSTEKEFIIAAPVITPLRNIYQKKELRC